MSPTAKRNLFLSVTVLLVVILVVASVVTILRGPRQSSVELISKESDGTLLVNDLYEGEMKIPYFDIPTCNYKLDDFDEDKGVINYTGGDCSVGIVVNSQRGEIDWDQVAESGVDFAMIRVGYREMRGTGSIIEDEQFVANIEGAAACGIPVGVYFYSKAVSDSEAEEEATFVMDKIRTYQISYPVCIRWEYDTNDDGSRREDSRVTGCNGTQITGFINTFCARISMPGYTAGFYCDKSMGYERLDLSQLKSYDMWYTEQRQAPSFYYDFKLWQYTRDGSVPGITEKVPIVLALKSY